MPVFSSPYTEGFESGVGDWIADAGLTIAVTTDDATDGTHSLRVTRTADTGESQAIRLPLTGLTPGANYRMVVSMLGEQVPWRGFSFGFGDSGFYGASHNNAAWSEYNLRGAALAADSPAVFELWNQTWGYGLEVGESVLIDGITMTEETSYTEDCEGLTLGSTNTGDLMYAYDSVSVEVSDAHAHSGTQSIRWQLSADPGRTLGTGFFSINPPYFQFVGRVITLSCWVRPDAGTTVHLAYGQYNVLSKVFTSVSSTGSGAWEQLVLTVPSDVFATYPYGQFCLIPDDPEAAIGVYIDDVSFTWDDTESVGYCGIIDFETFESFPGAMTDVFNIIPVWVNNPASSQFESSIVHGGARSLKVTSPVLGEPQDILNDVGQYVDIGTGLQYSLGGRSQDCLLKAWVYIEPGGSTVSMGRPDYPYTSFLDTQVVATTGSWVEVSVRSTFGEIADNGAYLFAADQETTETVFYVDSITIEIGLTNNIEIPIDIDGSVVQTGPFPATGTLSADIGMAGTLNVIGTLSISGSMSIDTNLTADPDVVYENRWTGHLCTVAQPSSSSPAVTFTPTGLTGNNGYAEWTSTGHSPNTLYKVSTTLSRTSDGAGTVVIVPTQSGYSNPDYWSGYEYLGSSGLASVFALVWSDEAGTVRARFNISPGSPDDDPWFTPAVITAGAVVLTTPPAPLPSADDDTHPFHALVGLHAYGADWDGTSTVYTQTTDQVHSGTYAWEVAWTDPGGGYTELLVDRTCGLLMDITDVIPTRPGMVFTVSAWVYVPSGSEPVALEHRHGIWWYEGPRNVVTSTTFDAWEQLSITINAEHLQWTINGSAGEIALGPADASVASTTFYVDDALLEWTEPSGDYDITFDADVFPSGSTSYEADLPFGSTSGTWSYIGTVTDELAAHSSAINTIRATLEVGDVWGTKFRSTLAKPGMDIVYDFWARNPSGVPVEFFRYDRYLTTPLETITVPADDAWHHVVLRVPNADCYPSVNNSVSSSIGAQAPTATGLQVFYVDQLRVYHTPIINEISVPIEITGDIVIHGTLPLAGSVDVGVDLTADIVQPGAVLWTGHRCDVTPDPVYPGVNVVTPRPSSRKHAWVERTVSIPDVAQHYEATIVVTRGDDGGDTLYLYAAQTGFPPSWHMNGGQTTIESGGTAVLYVDLYAQSPDATEVSFRVYVNADAVDTDWPVDAVITVDCDNNGNVAAVASYTMDPNASWPFANPRLAWGTSLETTTRTTEQAHSGTYSWKQEWPAQSNPSYDGYPGGWTIRLGSCFTIVPFVQIHIEAWVWVAPGSPAAIIEHYHGRDWFVAGRTYVTSSTHGSWQHLSLWIDSSDLMWEGSGDIGTILFGTSDGSQDSTIYWDDITISIDYETPDYWWYSVLFPNYWPLGATTYSGDFPFYSTSGLWADGALVVGDYSYDGGSGRSFRATVSPGETWTTRILPTMYLPGWSTVMTCYAFTSGDAPIVFEALDKDGNPVSVIDNDANVVPSITVAPSAPDVWTYVYLEIPPSSLGWPMQDRVDVIRVKNTGAEPLVFYFDNWSYGIQPYGGQLDAAPGITVPLELEGSAAQRGPFPISGTMSVDLSPAMNHGTMVGPFLISGVGDVVDLSPSGVLDYVQDSIWHYMTGQVDVDTNLRGGARMPVRLPPRPAPAPPEELGVFPMPAFGGTTIRAVAGKTVTMDTPTIVDGRPT